MMAPQAVNATPNETSGQESGSTSRMFYGDVVAGGKRKPWECQAMSAVATYWNNGLGRAGNEKSGVLN